MDLVNWVDRTRSSVSMYCVLTDFSVFAALALVLKYYDIITEGLWILPALWFGVLILSGIRRYYVREAYLSTVGRKELRLALTNQLKKLEGHAANANAQDALYYAMYDRAAPEEMRLDAAKLAGQLSLFDDAWEPLSEAVRSEWRSCPAL